MTFRENEETVKWRFGKMMWPSPILFPLPLLSQNFSLKNLFWNHFLYFFLTSVDCYNFPKIILRWFLIFVSFLDDMLILWYLWEFDKKVDRIPREWQHQESKNISQSCFVVRMLAYKWSAIRIPFYKNILSSLRSIELLRLFHVTVVGSSFSLTNPQMLLAFSRLSCSLERVWPTTQVVLISNMVERCPVCPGTSVVLLLALDSCRYIFKSSKKLFLFILIKKNGF